MSGSATAQVGQELLLGELDLRRAHGCSLPGLLAVTLRYILSRIQTESKLLPRAERRAAILHGAALAFASTGFADTSMEDVGAACGVTKLIVYRHFGSKEELYREILQQVFDDLGVELRAELAEPTHVGLGPRTLLTVAREDPAAFTLLWRHAAREPQFAAYAAELRGGGGVRRAPAQRARHRRRAARRLALRGALRLAGRDDAHLARSGATPSRDETFVAQTSAGFRALRAALTQGAALV